MALPETPTHPGVFATEEELLKRYTNANSTTLERFWDEIRGRGTPLREPGTHRVTFLWRHRPGKISPETAPVHLHINRVTDKDNHHAGFMTGIPGTDIWVRTLDLSPTLRASYGFTASPTGKRLRQGPPRHNHYPTRRDPLNPTPALVTVDETGHGLSLFTGAFSPPQPEWEPAATTAGPRGEVVSAELGLRVSEGEVPPRRCRLYLPPAPTCSEPAPHHLPLLTLFDAETWFDRLDLPCALRRAVTLGRIPPLAVLGVDNLGREDRIACLGANSRFLESVSTTATDWAGQQIATRGHRLAGHSGRIIAGQSLGGLSALLAAHILPGSYATAICQSPSLWWTPDGNSTPRDFGRRSADWITEESALRPPQKTRVRLDIGLREALTLPRTHQLDQTLRARGWDSRVTAYDGGHDFAWWRGALIDRLEEALRPH